jgi:BirA family transcriptional regulator, biotin operon repressor / biotin---[acetyl-CoA-carboxylase] ligase
MLMFSALLRDVPSQDASLVGLAAGVAVARAIGPAARLKWPNDVRIGGRKVCGILGELAPGGFVVAGIGVNVGHEEGDLAEELQATSLRIAGSPPRRDDLCVAILRGLDTLIGSDFMDEYRSLCETIGASVRVELSGRTFDGDATSVDDDGALVVSGQRVVAGDVIHVR